MVLKGVGGKKLSAAFVFLSCAWGAARAQAPPAIQIFMPDGDRPSRELFLHLTRDYEFRIEGDDLLVGPARLQRRADLLLGLV